MNYRMVRSLKLYIRTVKISVFILNIFFFLFHFFNKIIIIIIIIIILYFYITVDGIEEMDEEDEIKSEDEEKPSILDNENFYDE